MLIQVWIQIRFQRLLTVFNGHLRAKPGYYDIFRQKWGQILTSLGDFTQLYFYFFALSTVFNGFHRFLTVINGHFVQNSDSDHNGPNFFFFRAFKGINGFQLF